MLQSVDDQIEAQQQAVAAAIDIALRRGLSATRISFAAGDPRFVAKLRQGHNYRLSTLLRAHAGITALIDASTPAFLKDTA